MTEATLAQPVIDGDGNSNYNPCAIGLHLCGHIDDSKGAQPYTAANIPARTHDQAKAMFDAAKAIGECSEEAADFCCDLNLGEARNGPEHVDDFWTNRQLWPAILAEIARLQPRSEGGV